MGIKKVPLEAAVKYLIRERDEYKKKLETIIPYTRHLEDDRNDKVDELQQEIKKLRYKLDRKNRDYEDLCRECAILKRDYRQSGWFAALQDNNKDLREKVTTLRKALNQALVELKQLKDGTATPE